MKPNLTKSVEELLNKLKGRPLTFSGIPNHTDHLTWEEIQDYLEHRYELTMDDPKKRRVLKYISECEICYTTFSIVYEMVIKIKKGDVPEFTAEMKQDFWSILLKEREFSELTNLPSIAKTLIFVTAIAFSMRPNTVGMRYRGASSSNILIHKDDELRCEIFSRQNNLILSVKANSEDLIGKYFAVSIPSAYKMKYDNHILEWKQEGPENIESIAPINSEGYSEIVIAETKLDTNNPQDFHLLGQIFEEIELRIFKLSLRELFYKVSSTGHIWTVSADKIQQDRESEYIKTEVNLQDDTQHSYHLGDHINLIIESEMEGYLLLLDEGTEDSIYCLCPSYFAPDTHLQSGRTCLPQVSLPRKSFEIGGKPGREDLWAIISKEPLGLDWMPDDPDKPTRVLSANDIAILMSNLRKLDQDSWTVLYNYFDIMA